MMLLKTMAGPDDGIFWEIIGSLEVINLPVAR